MNSSKPLSVLCERKMVPIKQRLKNATIGVKRKAVKDLEKGMTNKYGQQNMVSQKTLYMGEK